MTRLDFLPRWWRECFYGVPTPLGGWGFAEIEAYVRQLCGKSRRAKNRRMAARLWCRRRRCATSPTMALFVSRKADGAESPLLAAADSAGAATVVGSTKQGAGLALSPFASFAAQTAEAAPTNLRDLLEIRPAGPELSVDRVEPPAALCTPFIASAMSFGSLSPEAHQTITEAMNLLERGRIRRRRRRSSRVCPD